MTAIPDTSAPIARIDTGKQRQARITGIVLLGCAVLVALVFLPDINGSATFRLSRPTDRFPIGNLVVPGGPFLYAATAILAFLGARQFLRGGIRWTSLSLGIGLAILVAAFLVWATAGKAFSLTGMLQATMVRAVPIALGGLAGVLSERVAVVNIAIEGMLLAGAFTGALVGSLLGGFGGLFAAVAVGGLFGFHPRRAGGDLSDGPDHRRRGDQPVRAWADLLRFKPGLCRASVPQQRACVPRLQDPAARGYSSHRTDVLSAKPVCLWCPDHGRRGHILSVSHPDGPARPRSGGAPARRRHIGYQRLPDTL